ncbi:hypothetical protein DSO57_1022039 [Entomophthora muscae]|uniref:Uncharacterized protein n=1 Tax=Entomophthora muscae TaxID=34485 RepID=A0ACC2RI19_9FUNG|nr:hypothetical protein DSO57_1022039 [Entomophthora muscae]
MALEVKEVDFEAADDGRVVYSKLKRYLVLGLVSIAGLLGPISSTIYFPSANSVITDLKTTSSKFDLTIGAFMITLGIMPLIWGSIADRYGRKWVYVLSMSIATAGNIGAGFSRSINELIGLRVLQAIGSSAAMVTGVGVIADIFPKEDIGLAMSTFFVGILIGPIMGPILGGVS